MSRRLSLAFLFAMFVYGLSVAFAPPVLAAKAKAAKAATCDFNTCVSDCKKRVGEIQAVGQTCNSECLQTMDERKKKGQCK